MRIGIVMIMRMRIVIREMSKDEDRYKRYKRR